MLLDEELFGRVKNVGAEMEGHSRSFLASQLMGLTSNVDGTCQKFSANSGDLYKAVTVYLKYYTPNAETFTRSFVKYSQVQTFGQSSRKVVLCNSDVKL